MRTTSTKKMFKLSYWKIYRDYKQYKKIKIKLMKNI